MIISRSHASASNQSAQISAGVRASWFKICVLGVAVCLLSACSTSRPSHNSLTLEDLWATANVERVDGGVTYVDRRFYGTGFAVTDQYFWLSSGHLRYPPRWMGGFHPYYSLYYPYYGYRPHYVWECPVNQQPSHPAHPDPVNFAGNPSVNPGFTAPVKPPIAPVPIAPVANAIPLADSHYVALEPGYRLRTRDAYLSGGSADTDRASGLSPGQVPNLAPQLGRPADSVNGAMAGLNARPGRNETLRTIQRPDPARSPGFGSQSFSSGRGSNSRPTRSISRSTRPSVSRTVNVSSARSEVQR